LSKVPFTAGRTIGRAFGVLGANLPRLLAVAAAIHALSELASYLLAEVLTEPRTLQIANSFLGMPFQALTTACLTRAVLAGLRKEPVRVLDSVRSGLRRAPAVVVLELGIGILTGVAALALLFPAVIVATTYFVAMPALIQEELGVEAALSRSRELALGSRVRIFGLLLALFLPLTGVTVLLGTLVPADGSVINAVLLGAFGAVGSLFSAITVVVAYEDLRRQREGERTPDVAEVFE
jgi:hypothetical protein